MGVCRHESGRGCRPLEELTKKAMTPSAFVVAVVALGLCFNVASAAPAAEVPDAPAAAAHQPSLGLAVPEHGEQRFNEEYRLWLEGERLMEMLRRLAEKEHARRRQEELEELVAASGDDDLEEGDRHRQFWAERRRMQQQHRLLEQQRQSRQGRRYVSDKIRLRGRCHLD